MGYTKNTWIDRIVQFPRRFRKSNEAGDLVELTPEPGTVTAAGTPVNAALLNHMEQGIKDALPKDGSEAMTGTLQAPKLSLTDYGSPMEIGRYIDIHKAGSSGDYDARISITDENQFRFEPAGGSGWELRNNGGLLEVNAGGGWMPVGGVKSVQRGIALADGAETNVTISSVNMSKSFITINQAFPVGSSVVNLNEFASVQLTSSTNLQFVTSAVAGSSIRVAWEVVEFY